MVKILLGYWAFLTVLIAVGGAIGWYQLRTDHHRASLYLSRILIAVAMRSLLTFIGLLNWGNLISAQPIYVAFSAFAATLLCGAIWGWLFYLRGIWNGGGWRDLWQQVKGNPHD